MGAADGPAPHSAQGAAPRPPWGGRGAPAGRGCSCRWWWSRQTRRRWPPGPAAPAQRRRVRPHLPPRCTVSARAEAGRSSDTRRETHCCGPSDTRAPHAAQSVRQDRRCAVVCRRAPRRAHRRQTLAQAQRAARAAAPSGRRCGRAARRLRGLRGHSQRGRGRRRCGWQGVRRLWRGRAARCQLPWRLPALVDAGMVTASAREQTPARSAQVQAPQQNGVAV